LFSLFDKSSLTRMSTRPYVADLKCSREWVLVAGQLGKWTVIRDLRAVIKDSPPPEWEPLLDFVAPRYFCIGGAQHVEEAEQMSLLSDSIK